MLIGISFFSCNAQKRVVGLLDNSEMDYIVSNITHCHVLSKAMFDASFYINIFEFSDSKTSTKYGQEVEEISSSFLITSVPDGDYYTESKLFKISGFLNPYFVNIEEIEYPKFRITIENGAYNNRKSEIFTISVEF
jgi:hypothetical protein